MFQELVKVLRFNDEEKRLAYTSPEKLQVIRSLLEKWNDSFLALFVAGCNLTAGEQLLRFCSHGSF